VTALLIQGITGVKLSTDKNVTKKPASKMELNSESKIYEAPGKISSITKGSFTLLQYHKYINTSNSNKYNYLLTEDFEGDFPPAEWTVQSQNVADSTWHQDSRWSHSGSNSAIVWWSYQPQNEWLITDSVILSGSPNDRYYFSFWTYAHKGSSYGDHYYVLIKTVSQTEWDTLLDFADFVAPDTGWVDTQYIFDISHYANDTVQIAFQAVADSGIWYIWAIDDVEFYSPYNHDVAVFSITSPQTDTVFPDDTVEVKAIIGNIGINEETFNARCIIDSEGVVVRDTAIASITLSADSSLEVSFGNFVFKGNHVNYGISVITELATDEDATNDTLKTVIYTNNPHAGGPDGYGYTFIDSDESGGPTFSWIDPTSGTPITLGDDDTVTIELPFSFPFYESAITHIVLSSNGFLAERTSNKGILNHELPDTTKFNLIAPWWDDMNPSAQGNIYYYVPVDSSYAVIAFMNVPHYGQTDGNTFEVVLYPNGNILMQYEHLGLNHINSSTIGIQGGKGLSNYHLLYTYNGTPVMPHDSLAVMFIRPVYNHDIVLKNVNFDKLSRINMDMPVEVAIFNNGINSESNVEIRVDVLSADSTLISSTSKTVAFIDTYSTVIDTLVIPGIGNSGKYYITAYSTLTTDERPDNDTIETSFYIVNRAIDFEYSSDRFMLESGWQWGEPKSEDEPVAHSGTKLLGTILGDNYGNDANFSMERKFVITGDNPVLLFYHWYDTESRYDGGNVKISKDNGQTFEILYPENGYPYDTISNSNAAIPGEPGFSGHPRKWELVAMPITDVSAGDTVIIKWQFGSDGSVGYYPGWYIDDVTGVDIQPYYPEHDLMVTEIEPSYVVEPNSYFIPEVHLVNMGLSSENFVLVTLIDSEGVNIDGQTFQVQLDSFSQTIVYLNPVFTGNEGITYHVKAKILPVEGEDTTNNYLEKAFTTARLEKIIDIPVALYSPDIDGIIKQGEWDDARSMELSDVYGQAGTEIQPLTAKMYFKVDTVNSRLFIAVLEKYDSVLSDYDQIGLFFDDNNDGLYPAPGSNTEGNYWLIYHVGGVSYNFRPIYSDGTTGDTIVMSYARGISLTDGTVSFEVEIPFGTQPEMINANPGDTLGFFAYAYDVDNDVFYGWWPQDLAMSNWNKPAYYGKLVLPAWTAVREQEKHRHNLMLLTRNNIFTRSPELTLSIPERTTLTLNVYDIQGRTVENKTLTLEKGIHTLKLRQSLASGVYFVRIATKTETLKKRIIISH